MSSGTAEPRDAGLLDRVLQPGRAHLAPEVARAFLQMGFDEDDRRRMLDLLAKCKADRLTPEEERDLDEYRRLGRFLDVLHSKARLALRRTGHEVG